MRLFCLSVMLALCGCGTTKEPVTRVGVLWGPAPTEASASPGADRQNAGLAPAGPMIQYDITMLSAPLEDFIASGLIRPGQDQAVVLRNQDVQDFIHHHRLDATGLELCGGSGAPACSEFISQFAFISDYTFDRLDVAQPVIGVLNIGNCTAIEGHVSDARVVLDHLDHRAAELIGVSTVLGWYPSHGVLQQYPWEEPNCLMSAALVSGPPITLTDATCVVVPCHYWTDRPSPAVHSRMVDGPVTGTAARTRSDSRNGGWPPHLLQQVIVIHAHGLKPGTLVSQPMQRSGNHGVSDLTPPWHRQQATIISP